MTMELKQMLMEGDVDPAHKGSIVDKDQEMMDYLIKELGVNERDLKNFIYSLTMNNEEQSERKKKRVKRIYLEEHLRKSGAVNQKKQKRNNNKLSKSQKQANEFLNENTFPDKKIAPYYHPTVGYRLDTPHTMIRLYCERNWVPLCGQYCLPDDPDKTVFMDLLFGNMYRVAHSPHWHTAAQTVKTLRHWAGREGVFGDDDWREMFSHVHKRDFHSDNPRYVWPWSLPITMFTDKIDAHSLYRVLVLRLYFLDRVLSVSLEWKGAQYQFLNHNVQQEIRVFQDYHMQMCQMMQYDGMIRDQDWLHTPRFKDSHEQYVVLPSLYDVMGPGDGSDNGDKAVPVQHLFHYGELEDMSMHVLHCEWRRSLPLPILDPEFEKRVSIMKRHVSQPCKGRNAQMVYADIIENDEDYLRYFTGFTMACFLGSYPTCKVTATTATRMWLYRKFSHHHPGKKKFLSFIRGHKHLTMFVVKEYMCCLIENLHPGLEKSLEESHYWSQIKEGVFDAMDVLRTTVNNFVHTNSMHLLDLEQEEQLWSQLLDKLERYLITVYKQHWLKFHTRNKEKSWHKKLVDIMTTIQQDNFYSRCVERGVQVDKATTQDLYPKFCFGLYTELSKRAQEMRLRGVRPHWFTLLDGVVNLEYLAFLRFAEITYEDGEWKSGTGTERYMCQVYEVDPNAFYSIVIGFIVWQECTATTFYRLPMSMIRLQIRGLRKMYGLKKGETLPPTAGCFYMDTKCFIIGKSSGSGTGGGMGGGGGGSGGQNSTGSAGDHCKWATKNLAIDPITGRVFNSTGNKEISKARTSSILESVFGPMFHQNERKAKTKFKTLSKQMAADMCFEHDVELVNFIGTIAVSSKYEVSVLMCPDCCKLGEYSHRNFRGVRYSCCTPSERMDLSMCTERKSPICNKDQVKLSPLHVLISLAMTKYMDTCCFYCGCETPEMRTYTVLDNEDPKNVHYRVIMLCKAHTRKWMHNTDEPLTPNIIRQGLSRGSYISMKDGQIVRNMVSKAK